MNNKHKHLTISYLYRILILFYLCWGSHAWFTWWADFTDKYMTFVVNIVFFLIAEFYRRTMKVVLAKDSGILVALTFLLLAIFTSTDSFGPLLIPNALLRMYPLYVLLSDKKNAPSILSFLMTSISVILIPGLVMHVIDIAVGMPIGFPSVYGDSYAYIFSNYGFMLKPMADYETDSGRFFSVFIEPGYLGVLLSLLLYASKFDFKKKQTWILLCGLLASFSLSGIVTTIIGYTFIRLSKDMVIKKMFLYVVLLLPVYFIGISYNDGDNQVNNLIIKRLQPDKENGLSGNNRVGEDFDIYFEKMVADGSILFGMGQVKAEKIFADENGIHGAGYKRYCVINGALSAIFFLLFYFYLGPRRYLGKNKVYLWGLFVMYILSFLPLGYALSQTWLTCYMIGYVNDSNKNAIYH